MYPPLFLLLCLKLVLALAGRAEPYKDVYSEVMTWLFELHWENFTLFKRVPPPMTIMTTARL